jgi:mono/diheme cytochrome c family protein
MKLQTVAALVALGLLSVRPLAAASDENLTTAVANAGAEAETAAKGKALYAHHCSHCHGFNMVNAGSIAYDLRQFPHNDKPRFVRSVTEGKNGRMPQWGDLLKSEEIDEIWAYVLTGGAQ